MLDYSDGERTWGPNEQADVMLVVAYKNRLRAVSPSGIVKYGGRGVEKIKKLLVW